MIAHSYNARGKIAQQFIRWECFWIKNRAIPETQAKKNKYTFSRIEDKELITDVRIYIKLQGDNIDK